jgi:hypothetical protein
VRLWPDSRSIVVACALIGAPELVRAQVAYNAPTGRVEVLGLRRWTLAMLQDSIRRYVPGQELHDAACMVTLRDSLHFAEASVEWFEMAPPGQLVTKFLTIKVIEPEQANRVQWDARRRSEFSSLVPNYAPFVLAITDSTGTVARGRVLFWLQDASDAWREQELTHAPAARRADAARLDTFLAERRNDSDRRRAMTVLVRDGLWVNRMMAAVVLANFADRDSTWWALARALRDPHEAVREAAATTLGRLPSRTVDWHPVASDLRLLLGGTNLPAMMSVFQLLTRTGVSPDLAPTLLHDNADWVLDHLGSETPMASDAAHALLVKLHSGQDLGITRAAWMAWTKTL